MTASERIRRERMERIALGCASLVHTGKALDWPEAVSQSARLLGISPGAIVHSVLNTRSELLGGVPENFSADCDAWC
jgi:hypothetical protein